MVYVAIVEDDARAAQRLENHLNRFAAETEEQLHIEIFPDALQFLDGYAPVWQLVFMDIEMPNIDGLDAAKRLRAIDEGVQIVFVTNMAQYAIQGYEVRAMDFIVKPVEYGSFFMKMKRAIRYIRANSPKQITVKRTKPFCGSICGKSAISKCADITSNITRAAVSSQRGASSRRRSSS